MRFADPELLALLALLPLGLALLRRRKRHPAAALRLPSLAALRPALTLRRQLLPLLLLLRVVAVALAILALARPQVGDAESLVPAEGIDIVLTLDVSGSMVQNRIGEESRLDAAKRVARAFIARRGEDRVGLVTFQAEVLVLSPLTLDLDALDALVAVSVANGFLPEGTAIGLALAESLELLRDSRAPSRVVVLLTDGEDNVRTLRPVQAGTVAEALGIRVYTIGIVAEDARQGPVDELALREIARVSGGRYFRAIDLVRLETAYADIEALESARVGGERFSHYDELAAWFLIPAVLLILLEVAGRATFWRRAP